MGDLQELQQIRPRREGRLHAYIDRGSGRGLQGRHKGHGQAPWQAGKTYHGQREKLHSRRQSWLEIIVEERQSSQPIDRSGLNVRLRRDSAGSNPVYFPNASHKEGASSSRQHAGWLCFVNTSHQSCPNWG